MNLIFVGAKAEGYWSGACEYEGVFVTKEVYEDNKFEIEEAFIGRTFSDLDGKYSETEGELIVRELNNVGDVAYITSVLKAEYAPWVLTEYLDEELAEHLYPELSVTFDEVEKMIDGLIVATYVVTEEEMNAIDEFLGELRKEGNDNDY